MPLVHVNGLPQDATKKNPVLTDIAIPEPALYKNFMRLTDGELYLDLKASQYELLTKSFPNHPDLKLWEQSAIRYRNAIFNGVHGTTGNTSIVGFLNPKLYEVQQDIINARKRIAAAGVTIDLKDRANVGVGTDPIIDIPYPTQCDQFLSLDEYGQLSNNNENWRTCYNDYYEGYQWEMALNQYLERSAHHLLYEFADDAQASQMRPTKAWKIGQHQQGVSLIADYSKLSRTNIREWHRLGIMRHNALKGAGALPPEQTINAIFADPNATFDNILKQYKDPETGQTVSVGNPLVVVYIIFACAAAIVSIAGLIQVIQGKEPTAFDRLAGIGKALFSAQGGDNILGSLGSGNNDNTDTNTNTDTGTGSNTEGGNNNGNDIKNTSWYEKNKGLVWGGAAAAVVGVGIALTSDSNSSK